VAPHQVARVDRIPPPVSKRELAPPPSEEASDPRLAGARYYTSGLPRPKPGFYGQGGPEFSSATQVASIDPDAEFDPHEHAKPSGPSTPAKTSGHFVWPVRGQIISGFGRRANGVHNDGINIAAEPGSAVKAAEAGVVVYAGNELAGYGNLLLIRHANGFVTAYAHNKKLLVDKGATVRQGQTIALVGSTGDVDRPQLHFEIRKGDRAVDPGHYLESANASL
jgi:murein DD-endopeptidase MepM/ murein hydrolase activator NlpD